MSDNQFDSTPFNMFLNSLHRLQNYIATEPDYYSMIDDIISSDDDEVIDETSDKNDDDILFNRDEWLVTDPFTKRIRPPQLIEFLCLILDEPRYISYISWLNIKDGLFRIHKPNQVIRLWEMVRARQKNSPMNFDGFSRCIRCYYKPGLMIPTYKKLTFQFAF